MTFEKCYAMTLLYIVGGRIPSIVMKIKKYMNWLWTEIRDIEISRNKVEKFQPFI